MDYAVKGGISNQAVKSASSPELELLGSSLGTTNESCSLILDRLARAIERIAGPSLSEVGKDQTNPQPAGHIANIRAAITALDSKMARFNSLVERLESIG